MMKSRVSSLIVALVVVLACMAAAPVVYAAPELELAPEDTRRMDPFEQSSLARADKSFKENQYKRALAEYDSFMLEFPSSRVMPYILLRKARSIDLDNKRFEAIAKYKAVLDYYPNAVHYAAAALYYMGDCYWDVGNQPSALKIWLELAQDEDYRKHYLAADALNRLSDYYASQNQMDKAVACYEQVVVNFRLTNPQAAKDTILKVAEDRIRNRPDEAAFRAFYVKARGVDASPKPLEADVAASTQYWQSVIAYVNQFGPSFTEPQVRQRKAFYKYWAAALDGKFPAWDDFQINQARFQLAADGSENQFVKRLDEQFAKYQKPGDVDRIIKWTGLYPGNQAKTTEYYNKLDLAKLSQERFQQLLFNLLNQKQYAMARNLFDKLTLKDMPDPAKARLAQSLYEHVRAGFSTECLVRLCDSFTDKDYGNFTLLYYYYHYAGNLKDAMPVAESLTRSAKYADQAHMYMGDILTAQGQYEKAIAHFQQANQPPETQFRIAACYVKLDKINSAVNALQEVQNFFPNHAARAALETAHIYQCAGLQDKYIAALRQLMKKYRDSGESTTAHQELQKLGIKIGGGVDSE